MARDNGSCNLGGRGRDWENTGVENCEDLVAYLMWQEYGEAAVESTFLSWWTGGVMEPHNSIRYADWGADLGIKVLISVLDMLS